MKGREVVKGRVVVKVVGGGMKRGEGGKGLQRVASNK